jgi:AraC-like DNA-binding protein
MGVIRSRDSEFKLTTNSILRLPWRHEVDYRADAKSPFHVGTIHVVPWHDRSVVVTPRVAHLADDPLLHVSFRRGVAVNERPTMMTSRSAGGRNVIGLASYAVEKFLSSAPDSTTLRALGVLIMSESAAWSEATTSRGQPVMLEIMTDFVIANIGRQLSVGEIAEAADCSVATAERLFAKYTGQSVLAWVRSRRMQEAAALLRTSSLRASEVARLVGYTDPLYFSRVFRATFSVPPSKYAAGQLRP